MDRQNGTIRNWKLTYACGVPITKMTGINGCAVHNSDTTTWLMNQPRYPHTTLYMEDILMRDLTPRDMLKYLQQKILREHKKRYWQKYSQPLGMLNVSPQQACTPDFRTASDNEYGNCRTNIHRFWHLFFLGHQHRLQLQVCSKLSSSHHCISSCYRRPSRSPPPNAKPPRAVEAGADAASSDFSCAPSSNVTSPDGIMEKDGAHARPSLDAFMCCAGLHR